MMKSTHHENEKHPQEQQEAPIITSKSLPTSSLHGSVLTWTFGKQVPNLLHLSLEHSLHALRLALQLTMERLTLLLDLLLHYRKLLGALVGKLRELPFQLLVLIHQHVDLILQIGQPLRDIIRFHRSGQLGQHGRLDAFFHLFETLSGRSRMRLRLGGGVRSPWVSMKPRISFTMQVRCTCGTQSQRVGRTYRGSSRGLDVVLVFVLGHHDLAMHHVKNQLWGWIHRLDDPH